MSNNSQRRRTVPRRGLSTSTSPKLHRPVNLFPDPDESTRLGAARHLNLTPLTQPTRAALWPAAHAECMP